MKNIDLIKKKIKDTIYNKLSVYNEVVSVTLPGSFQIKDDISIISDIDVIIIIEKLYEEIYNKIINSFKITGEDFLLPGYTVKINSTFGPLKFNSNKVIVLHLMIYDIEGHVNHVIKSPFTCNDWQKTPPLYGKALNQIYPSNPLQLGDLISKRRGIEAYAKDLDSKSVSYREYLFEKNKVKEIKKNFTLNDRLKKEYAFHIIKFLILNILKILNQRNIDCSELELIKNFKRHTNKFPKLLELFEDLYEWKYNYGMEPSEVNSVINSELKLLNIWYSKLVNDMTTVSFIRHAKTDLNDGSFLGIKRDPDILKSDSLINNHFEIIYSGTLKRTISTANLFPFDKHVKSSLINEIDYGLAEGLTFSKFKVKYPDIVKKWEKGEDPKFPEGENQSDVLKRLDLFLENKILNSKHKNIAVISHNVVIRVLLSKFYNIDHSLIHLMQPEHLELISFKVYNGTIIPDLNEKQRNKFRDQFMEWN